MSQVKKQINKLKYLSYRSYLVLFVVLSLVCVMSLRHNNQQMINLRNQVYVADKSGGDVSTALNNLRGYVYGHMNTNLSSGGNAIKPPIQLKYTYERLLSTEQKRVDAANQQIYTNAQKVCEARYPSDYQLRARAACTQNYVAGKGVKAQPISPALYEFDFLSPAWSPDLAGLSLIAASLAFIAFLLSFIDQKLRRQI